MDTIGILGAGRLGAVLAKRLIAIGRRVRIANSRDPSTLMPFARQIGAKAASASEIAAGVNTLVIAIPLGRIRTLPAILLEALPRTPLVIDAGNYVPPRDGTIDAIEAGLPETAWVQRQLGVPVLKAFNNITDYSLEHEAAPRGTRRRIALPVSGDDPTARGGAMALIDDLGFDPFDAGPLSQSWRQQIGQPAYCTNPTLDQLRSLLDRADPSSVSLNRKKAMELMAKLPPDLSKQDLVRAARFMTGLDRHKPSAWLAMLRIGAKAAGAGK